MEVTLVKRPQLIHNVANIGRDRSATRCTGGMVVSLDRRIPIGPRKDQHSLRAHAFEALVEPGGGQVLVVAGVVLVIPEAESRYAAVIDELLDVCRAAGPGVGGVLARRLAHIATADDSTGQLAFGLAVVTDRQWSLAVHGPIFATIDDEIVISGTESLIWREILLERPFSSVRIASHGPSSFAASALTPLTEPGTAAGSGVLLKPRPRDPVDLNHPGDRSDGWADGGPVTEPYRPIATAPYSPPAGVLVLDDGTSRPLEGTVVLGREPGTREPSAREPGAGDATTGPAHLLVLNDAVNGVSRVHAEITVTGAGAVVTDLGSANGTYVCDRLGTWTRLSGGQAAPVGDGSRLRIGERQLHITALPQQNGSST